MNARRGRWGWVMPLEVGERSGFSLVSSRVPWAGFPVVWINGGILDRAEPWRSGAMWTLNYPAFSVLLNDLGCLWGRLESFLRVSQKPLLPCSVPVGAGPGTGSEDVQEADVHMVFMPGPCPQQTGWAWWGIRSLSLHTHPSLPPSFEKLHPMCLRPSQFHLLSWHNY